MNNSFYSKRKPEEKQLIDALIFTGECFRMMGAKFTDHDPRKPIQDTVDARIDFLRKLYAEDMENGTSRFAYWRADKAKIIQGAIEMQQNYAGITDGKYTMHDYLERLDLPYPEQRTQRGGRG